MMLYLRIDLRITLIVNMGVGISCGIYILGLSTRGTLLLEITVHTKTSDNAGPYALRSSGYMSLCLNNSC
jgi:hypothetical protein